MATRCTYGARLDVDNELLAPCFGRYLFKQTTLPKLVGELCLIDFHQCAMVKEKVLGRRLPADRFATITQLDSAAGNNEVHV